MELVVAPVLLVEEEPEVLNLLPAGVSGHHVLIVSVVVIVILHEFLVLDVSIFLLNGIELVSESKIVFVSLLNLKDFSFELGDEQILLVTGEMHRVVVFSHIVYFEFIILSYKRVINSFLKS